MISGMLLFMSSFAFLVSVAAVGAVVLLVVVLNRLPSVQRRDDQGESLLHPASGRALCPRSGPDSPPTPKDAATCRKPDGSCTWHGERGVDAACIQNPAPIPGSHGPAVPEIVHSAPATATDAR